MRLDFIAAAIGTVKQDLQDIGFGMLLPDKNPGDKLWEAAALNTSLIIVGAGVLLNNASVSLVGCAYLTGVLWEYRQRGKDIREELYEPHP